jgi:hypothetical protein
MGSVGVRARRRADGRVAGTRFRPVCRMSLSGTWAMPLPMRREQEKVVEFEIAVWRLTVFPDDDVRLP